jgi:ferrous iron transport protein B
MATSDATKTDRLVRTASAGNPRSCCGESFKDLHFPPDSHVITVALAGQPNVGKSTVFNVLTGLSQHVGNWPGKTVEQKVGACSRADVALALVDLPGTYSLTAGSEEERVTRDFIINEQPDVVVLVADAAALERNLYLLAELLLLQAPVILALNMMDVARQRGVSIDVAALSQALGLPVVPMAAASNEGVEELVEAIAEIHCDRSLFAPNRPQTRPDHRAVVAELLRLVTEHVEPPYEPTWVAVKLLEGDAEVTARAREWLPDSVWQQVRAILLKHEDAILDVAGGRYEWIEQVLRGAVSHRGLGQVGFTERFDRVATHPVGGLLLLGAAAAAVLWVGYAIGGPLQGWLGDTIVIGLGGWVRGIMASAPAWLRGLLVDALIGGGGTVLSFVPILAIFFVALGLLEDTGYMARAAFVMDRFMHTIGLHGRSFLPLFIGFGCNVPAVMGARIVDSRRGRLVTILLAPLVPCPARLGVVTTLAAMFFGPSAFLVTLGIVAISLLALAAMGVLLNLAIPANEQTAFIMELPLYHRPNWRTIGLFAGRRTREFLERAGTVMLAGIVLVWALSTLPHGDLETSYLAAVGKALEPLSKLMGMDWKLMLALLSSFVAKENSLAVIGVLYSSAAGNLAQALTQAVSAAGALGFLVVQMLFIPCAATLAAIKQETHSWKWTLVDVGMLTVVSFIGGFAVYHLALLFGLG